MTGERIDVETRERLAAHLRRLKWERGIRSAAALGRRIGVSRAAAARFLTGDRPIGFEAAIKIHRKLGVSLDTLVDEATDERWYSYDPARDGELPEPEPGFGSSPGRSIRPTPARSGGPDAGQKPRKVGASDGT